ncbi:phospholipase D-like domain-containing protein [Modicisalibacter luteus]|uniref:phospholipase D-like domain-containing protein n=1 Tax=Modicisalibacter luteus TaxID=453962 RepID=UPI003636C722
MSVLRNGIEIFPLMLEAIRQARFSVDFLTFVYWKGEVARQFADGLTERASAGVRVRVILDAIGALKMSKTLIERMRAAGVDVVWFRPLARWKLWELDNRTHRKVLVCDSQTAFTGGVGIAEEWEGMHATPTNGGTPISRLRGLLSTGYRPPSSTTGWRRASRCMMMLPSSPTPKHSSQLARARFR